MKYKKHLSFDHFHCEVCEKSIMKGTRCENHKKVIFTNNRHTMSYAERKLKSLNK